MKPSNRRLFRFSLRAALLLITVVAIWFGIQANRARRFRTSLEILQLAASQHAQQGYAGFVFSGLELDAPAWLVRILGEDFFAKGLVATYEAINDEGLDMVAESRYVRTLEVSGLKHTDEGVSKLLQLKHLRNLGITGGEVTDTSLSELSQIEELEVLSLYNTQITKQGLTGFQRKRPDVLVFENIDDDIDLSQFKSRTELLALNGFRKVTDEQLAYLVDGSPEISELYIAATGITDEGVKSLLGFKSLRVLALDGNAISDESVPYLKELTTLRKLSIKRTGITEAGVYQLETSLPDCEIQN